MPPPSVDTNFTALVHSRKPVRAAPARRELRTDRDRDDPGNTQGRGQRVAARKALPWFILKLASPFNETLRELCATRPLWETPIDLDNNRLVQFLGQEPHTPLDKAVDTTLRALGCLVREE